jgi:nucleoside-diphosphate-sugar epimerase
VKIFGTDWDTRDGTCLRDFIHVVDLADAHIRALEHLRAGGQTTAYNLGNSQGHTVKEVIEATERVTGRDVNALPRRAAPATPRGSSPRATASRPNSAGSRSIPRSRRSSSTRTVGARRTRRATRTEGKNLNRKDPDDIGRPGPFVLFCRRTDRPRRSSSFF